MYCCDVSYAKKIPLLLAVFKVSTLSHDITLFLGILLTMVLIVVPVTLSLVPTVQYFIYTYFGLNLFNFELALGPTTLGLAVS
jgi:hypothetical protein